MLDRTERLSFFTSRGIDDLSQIKNKLVTTITIDNEGRLVFRYNDQETLVVARSQGAAGISTHIAAVNVDQETGNMTITDSNGLAYEIGSVYRETEGIVGDGVYVGKVNGKHTFKPLVFSEDFIENNGLFGTTLGSAPGSLSDKRTAYATGFNNGSITANGWRNRPLDELHSDLEGASLQSGALFLPEGKYFIKHKAGTYRTGWGGSRLLSTTTSQVKIVGSTYMSNTTTNQTELTSYGMGIIDIQAGGESLMTQSRVSTNATNQAWSRQYIQAWRIE